MKAAKSTRRALNLRRMVPAIASLTAFAAGAQQAAKPADKETEQLEQITVTATKRAEPLQSVPVAITV